MRELRLGLLGREEPDAGALLRARLGEDELAAALEAQPERGRLRAFLPRTQVAHTARGHQVDLQDELAVVGREEEVFAAALGAFEPAAVEGLQRRVDRLQRRDVGRPRALDRER